MSGEETLEAASARLKRAVEHLEQAMDAQREREAFLQDAEAEIQRMTADRGRLAGELDEAKAHAGRLEEANREVSRRLVGAMETIRAVIEADKQRTGNL